ncbi:MAG: hypothetical protein KY445_13850 [Armatimonadetes bacterium]|nr:hypothetical protein [Armatimonadota bacterium]
MRWLRKRLGLKLFAACWLLVLLIPSWRQDAREQWGSETWSFENSTRGLNREKTALLASRSRDDWAAQLEHISAQYPWITSDSFAKNAARQRSFFDDYARLSRRFPRENAIRKAWLRDVTRGYLDIDWEAAYAHLPAQDRPKKQENWLPKSQIEAAIAAAREGAKIEPQNSFFPWMETVFQFALKRPDDALASLERASRGSYFDDGTLQTVRRRLELLSRVQNVGWGDKSRALWSFLLPHFGKIHLSVQAAMKISSQAQRRGDKGRALQIAATVARAGATLSVSKDSLITVSVGESIQQTAWRDVLKSAGRDIKAPRFPGGQSLMEQQQRLAVYQSHYEELARAAAVYARELNQEAIAEQALNTLPHLKGQQLAASYQENAFNGTFRDARHLAKAFWHQSRLMRLSLVGAVLWVVAFALTFRAALPADFKRAMASWAAFCVGATAVLLGVGVVYFGLGSTDGFFLDDGERVSSYALEYARNLSGLVALLWSFPVIVTALLNVVKGHAMKRPRLILETRGFSAQRMVKILIYGVMSLSVATFSLIAGLAPSGGSDWDRIVIALFFVFGVSVVAAGVFHAATTSGNQCLAATLAWAVPWLLLGAIVVHESFHHTIWAVLILALALVFLGLSVHLANRTPPTIRFFFDVMARTRVLAATLAVASAIFYVGVKIAVLPQEARMSAILDAQLQRGEVAWLEERLKR